MKPTRHLLHPEVRATIAVILEDARRRFTESPRMSRRIERALLALTLATVEHQIAQLYDNQPIPATLRRQGE